MTDIASFTNLVKNFCEERDWDQFHSPKDLAIGVTTEAAELLDLFRFKSDQEIVKKLNEPAYHEKVQDEIADVFFFVLRFAQMNNIDLEKALTEKLAKNAAKYPVESSKGSNKKYNE